MKIAKIKQIFNELLKVDFESVLLLIICVIFGLLSMAIIYQSLWLAINSLMMYSQGYFENFTWMTHRFYNSLFSDPGLFKWWLISASLLLGYEIYLSYMERILKNRKNPENTNG